MHFLLDVSFLRSLNSCELFVLFYVSQFFDARDISFVALRLSGERSPVFFCLSAGFVFRDVARGSEPMIRFLTMVKALTSLVGMSFIPRKIP